VTLALWGGVWVTVNPIHVSIAFLRVFGDMVLRSLPAEPRRVGADAKCAQASWDKGRSPGKVAQLS